MKKNLFLIFLGLSGLLGAQDLRLSLGTGYGLGYNGEFDPGWSSMEIEAGAQWPTGLEGLRAGAGLEWTLGSLGSQVGIPLDVEYRTPGVISWSLGTGLTPSLTLTRPRALWVFSTRVWTGARWNTAEDSFWGLRLGGSWVTSPEYSALVSPYNLIDMNLELEWGFTP